MRLAALSGAIVVAAVVGWSAAFADISRDEQRHLNEISAERRMSDDRERRILIGELAQSRFPDERRVASLMASGRVDEALDLLQRFAQSNADSVAGPAWRKLAVLAAEEDPARAAAANRRALAIDPDNFYYALAVLEDDIALGRLEEAARQARRLVVLARGRGDELGRAELISADIAMLRGAHDEAATLYDRAVLSLAPGATSSPTMDNREDLCRARDGALAARAAQGDVRARERQIPAILECIREASRVLQTDEVRAHLLLVMATRAYRDAPTALARTLVDEADEVAASITGDEYLFQRRMGELEVLRVRANIALVDGDGALAQRHLEHALRIANEMRITAAQRQVRVRGVAGPVAETDAMSNRILSEEAFANAEISLAGFFEDTDRPQDAVPHYEALIRVLRDMPSLADRGDNLAWLATSLGFYARALNHLGRFDEARTAGREALDHVRSYYAREPNGDPRHVGVFVMVMDSLDWSVPSAGREAEALMQEAHAIASGIAQRRPTPEVRSIALLQRALLALVQTANGDRNASAQFVQLGAEASALQPLLPDGDTTHLDFLHIAFSAAQRAGDIPGYEAVCRAMLEVAQGQLNTRRAVRTSWAMVNANSCLGHAAYDRGDATAARAAYTAAIAAQQQPGILPRDGAYEGALAENYTSRAFVSMRLNDVDSVNRDLADALSARLRAYSMARSPSTVVGVTLTMRNIAAVDYDARRFNLTPPQTVRRTSEPLLSSRSFSEPEFSNESENWLQAVEMARECERRTRLIDCRRILLTLFLMPLERHPPSAEARDPAEMVQLARSVASEGNSAEDRVYLRAALTYAGRHRRWENERDEGAALINEAVRLLESDSADVTPTTLRARAYAYRMAADAYGNGVNQADVPDVRYWRTIPEPGPIHHGFMPAADLTESVRLRRLAVAALTEIPEREQNAGDVMDTADMLYDIGLAEAHIGHEDLAREAFEQAQDMSRRAGRDFFDDARHYEGFQRDVQVWLRGLSGFVARNQRRR